MKIKNHFNKTGSSTYDPGFGTLAGKGNGRLINANGNFNVKRKGLGGLESINTYHSLINMSWIRFNITVLITYTIINIVFACVYYYLGVQHLLGVLAVNKAEEFWEAFFFSAQTLTTVGYGRISPVGMSANVVASIESMTGLLGFALATGILYGRFSKPNAKLLLSQNAVVAPYKNITGLMCRIANARSNQLIEAEAQFLFSWIAMDANGKRSRTFMPLTLERSKLTFLALGWTIVHPIDEESPLWGATEQQLLENDAELMIIIKAFDDTFSQTVHTRASYKHHEVVWGAKFVSMYNNDGENSTVLELDKIGVYEKVPLPQPAAIEENN